jgi:hypothetical protein
MRATSVTEYDLVFLSRSLHFSILSSNISRFPHVFFTFLISVTASST